MVDPATADDRDAVEVCNVISREEGRADVADEATNGVHGKDIEGIVNAEKEFELGAVVGEGGAENTEGDSGPDRNVTWYFCQ